MKRRALLGHLQEHGCVPVREGGSHSIWSNAQTGRKEAIPGTTKSRNSWRAPSAAICPFRFRPAINPVMDQPLNKQLRQAKSLLRQTRQTVEDVEDARTIERAKSAHGKKPRIPWAQVKKEAGLD